MRYPSAFRCVARLIVALAVLAASLLNQPGLAAETSPPRPKPGTRQYAREVGWPNLVAGHWEEATQVYGLWLTSGELQGAWRSRDKSPPAEQDRYRCQLVDFFFRTLNFTPEGWKQGVSLIVYYGREYEKIADGVPAALRRGALDLAHLDLLETLSKTADNSTIPGPQRDQVVEAIKEAPNSLPAIAALMVLLTVHSERGGVNWDQAAQLATSPLAKLTLGRAAATAHTGLTPELKRKLVEAAIPLAPSSDECAHLWYRIALMEAGTSQGSPEATAEKTVELARRAFERSPTAMHSSWARELAVSTLANASKHNEALALVRSLQGDEEQRGGLDRGLFTVAGAYLTQKEYDKSERLLLEIVRDYADTATPAPAMLRLAQIAKLKNDRPKRLEWLRKCMEFRSAEATDAHWDDGTHAAAVQELAVESERDGRWEDALGLWRQWTGPRTHCGTGHAFTKVRRHEHVTTCLLHLGRVDDAIRECVLAINTGSASWSSSHSETLFQIYAQADQLGELMAFADALERHQLSEMRRASHNRDSTDDALRQYTTAWHFRRLKQVDDLRGRNDIDALIALCIGPPSTPQKPYPTEEERWTRSAAADALARCDEDAVEPIRQALERQLPAANSAPLLTALAKHPSPHAWKILKKIAASGHAGNLERLLNCISLRGDAGVAWLKRMAAKNDPYTAHYVRAHLSRIENDDLPPSKPWPIPRPGTLPKSAELAALLTPRPDQ